MTIRSRLSEIRRESELIGRLFLIVEGNSDRRFFKSWLDDAYPEYKKYVSILPVEEVEIPEAHLRELGLTVGQKQRVVCAATWLRDEKNIRFVADLDCGHLKEHHSPEPLWWTDFPALESYALDEATLDLLNSSMLSDRLPSSSEVIGQMYPILKDLYWVRLNNEDMENPRISKGFGKSEWDVQRTVSPDVAARFDSYEELPTADPRSYAYGHDICEVLMCLYSKEIKHNSKINSPQVLENALLLSLRVSKSFNSSPLAKKLEEWLGSSSSEHDVETSLPTSPDEQPHR